MSFFSFHLCAAYAVAVRHHCHHHSFAMDSSNDSSYSCCFGISIEHACILSLSQFYREYHRKMALHIAYFTATYTQIHTHFTCLTLVVNIFLSSNMIRVSENARADCCGIQCLCVPFSWWKCKPTSLHSTYIEFMFTYFLKFLNNIVHVFVSFSESLWQKFHSITLNIK